MKKRIWLLMVFLGVAAMVAGGCGGGGGGGGTSCAAPTVNVTGYWSVTETMGSNTCDYGAGVVTTIYITFTQNGSSVTESTGTFSGQICGNILKMSGTSDGDSETITVTVDSNVHFGGSKAFTGSNGCYGTASVTGNKQ